MLTDAKVGDIVRLRSGGPDMTIRDFEGTSWVHCEWFTDVGEPKNRTFSPEMLEPITQTQEEIYRDVQLAALAIRAVNGYGSRHFIGSTEADSLLLNFFDKYQDLKGSTNET